MLLKPGSRKVPAPTDGGHLFFHLAREKLDCCDDAKRTANQDGPPPAKPDLPTDTRLTDQTRRFFGGRQPLCGSGVTSSMPVTFRPAC